MSDGENDIPLNGRMRAQPLDVEAWCNLARAHEDNHALSSALGAYSKAISINPRDPGPLLAVADAFVRQNYTLDAAHALRQVLRLEPANRKANALLQILVAWLQPCAQCIEQYAQSSPACSTPYEIYLNPFELLDYRIPSLPEWDDAAARRAKKRMLAELDLNDGRLPWINGVILDRSRAISVIDELDSIEQKQLHYLVFRSKRLLRFLTHGDLRFFAYDATPNANLGLLLPREPDEMSDVLGECFAKQYDKQYDRQLANCLASSQPLLLLALSSRHLPVSARNLDACYASAYERLRRLKGDIEAVSSSVANSPQAAREALTFLREQFSVECLNALPPYFREVRSEIAITIRGMSVQCYNAHQDAALSKEMLDLATSLATNESTKAKLDSDVAEIAEIATRDKRLFIYRNLTPLDAAPSLSTTNGCGFTLYGSSDCDAETGSHMATYYFVVLGIPIFPIRRYRVIQSGNSYRFLGKAPLRQGGKIHLGISIGIILLLIAIGLISAASGPQGTSSRSVPPSYNPTPRYSPPQPNIPRQTYSDSGLSSRIDSGKARAKMLESEITRMDSDLESLSSRIIRHKQEIEGYENQARLGLNVNRSLYQQALDNHNALVGQYNTFLIDRNAKYAEYSREIDSVNDMVRRFNSGER